MATFLTFLGIVLLAIVAKVWTQKRANITSNTSAPVVNTTGADNSSPSIWEKAKTKAKEWLSQNWKETTLFIVGFVACHIILWIYFKDFYAALANKSIFWVAHPVGVYAYFSRKDVTTRGKTEKRLTVVARVLVGLVIIVGVVELYNEYKTGRLTSAFREERDQFDKNRRTQISSDYASPLPTLNEEGAKQARKAFTEAGLSPEEAQEMVEICHRESGCNQFEPDGKTVLTGRQNRKDKGKWQINTGWLEAEIEKYGSEQPELKSWDVNTEEGNTKIAIYYRKKYGLLPWKATAKFKETFVDSEVITTAPLAKDGWIGDVIPFNGRVSRIGLSGNVKIKDEHGRSISAGPTSKIELGKVQSLQFMSQEEYPVTVTIKFYN